VRRLWADVNTIKQREVVLAKRQQRKARDAFVGLLRDLQSEEKITPRSTWTEVHQFIENDQRYKDLIENVRTGDEKIDGSTPQDLFFDLIDDLDQEVHELWKSILSALKVGSSYDCCGINTNARLSTFGSSSLLKPL